MRTALRVIAWGAASSVALACHGDLSSAVEINGRVSIAINRQLLIASPLDSIELQAQQGGSVQVYAKKLTSADTIVPFNIHVKPGTVRFTAQVRSNTGSLLYAGDTTQDIKDDIRVTLRVTAQNPILSVSPESLGVTGFDTARFAVTNKGIGSTPWSRDTLSVPAPCPLKGPLRLQPPVAGVVARAEVDTARMIRSSGADLSTTLCTIRFASSTGYVDVRVLAAPD